MTIHRRDVLRLAAGAVPLLCTSGANARDEVVKRTSLGIGSASYGIAMRQKVDGNAVDLRDPLNFLEFCRARGAGGIQTGLDAGSTDSAKQLRARAEETGMFIEGSLRVPRDKGDVERFEAEVRYAKDCGARVLRTVMLGGRRYETFKSADEFRRFRADALDRLRLAEPVVARHKMRLAVENHKDFRADGLAELMRRIDSPHVGVCVDTGNNLALLDDPYQTVETLAPWAASAHLKDMGVEEYADGFLLSEVPLGEGMLDLKRIVAALKKANPRLRLSLEMITRDPLKIPCLTDGYWATFGDLPGRALARTLSLVRRNKPGRPLPRVGGLSADEQLGAEDENVRKSLAFARDELDL